MTDPATDPVTDPADGLPRPFYDDGWTEAQRGAAQSLWRWHLNLRQAAEAGADAEALEREAARVQEGAPLTVLPEAEARAAYAACAEHDLPLGLLAEQVRAASRMAGSLRFADNAERRSFIASWACPLGRLLCRLAGAKGSWQLGYADALAEGFFLTGRLLDLPRDLAKDGLYIPLSSLEKAGVTVGELQEGRASEAVQRLLWREMVRARDAFGQGQPLVHELERRPSAALKRWWLGALALLSEVERRRFDVWSAPVELSPWQRLHVRYQARFGRATFKAR